MIFNKGSYLTIIAYNNVFKNHLYITWYGFMDSRNRGDLINACVYHPLINS